MTPQASAAQPSPARKPAHHSVWHFIALTALAATVFFVLAILLEKYHVLSEISRDLAIACVVAIIVTLLYELHARTLYDLTTITGVLQAVMGDMVHPDIWEQVKIQIIDRDLIRDEVTVKLSVTQQDEELRALGQAVLTMEFSYDIYGLKSESHKEIEVTHYLDDHIKNSKKNLPRFEKIIIGEKRYETPEAIAAKTVNGIFRDEHVIIEPRHKTPLKAVATRKELTYIPGSYNITMRELTKKITLLLEDIPPGIETSLNVSPHTPVEGEPLVKGTPTLLNLVLLPGQVIELRFKRAGH